MSNKKIKLPEDCPSLNSYYVYLTGDCNLACKHCWLSPNFHRNGGTDEHLDYKLFVQAIEEGIPLGLNHVKLTGGEPLLHPDFTRIITFLKEKNINTTMETNGTLLTKSLAQFLKEKSSLTFIAVSIDGANPETHDNFRGVKGSFEKACKAVQYLAEVGYKPQIIMSIHKDNVNEMKDLVRLAEKLGAGSVKFNLIQPTGRGELMIKRGEVLDIRCLIEIGKWVENELQEKTPIRLHYSWPMAFFGIKRLRTFNSYSCGIFNILGILHTGHIAMCGIGVHIPELCYGLIGKDSIYEVWTTNPLLIDLRKKLPAELEGICGECIFRNICLGTCVAENYHLAKKLTAPYWFCQMAKKENLFPIARLRLKKRKNFSATNNLSILIKTKRGRQLNEI